MSVAYILAVYKSWKPSMERWHLMGCMWRDKFSEESGSFLDVSREKDRVHELPVIMSWFLSSMIKSHAEEFENAF